MKEAEFEALIAANPDKTITSRKIRVKIGDYDTMKAGVADVEKRLEGNLSATKRSALEQEREGLLEAMGEMDQALCAEVQNYFDNYEKYQENSRRLAAGREKAKLQKSAPPAESVELTIDEDKLREQREQQQQQSQEAAATDVAPIAQNTAVVAGGEPAGEAQEGEKKKGGWLSTLLFVGLAIVTFGAVKANMDSKY